MEQYFSSAPLARLMASMMDYQQNDVRILDPGAGVGSLFTACVEKACGMEQPPRRISVTAYEVDSSLVERISDSLDMIREFCKGYGVQFLGNLIQKDFIADYCSGAAPDGFTHAIMNPPYGKIGVSSHIYGLLRSVGLQTTNTYAAFVAISQNMLCNGGQLVFISPRSFCNGRYFDRFRKMFLESMTLRHIHLFGSRTSSFRDDDVLQENVIIHAEKLGSSGAVTISSSAGPQDNTIHRHVAPSEVVFGDDPRRFIHIVPDVRGASISSRMRELRHTLDDLGLSVSTGRVVDFRIRSELRPHGVDGTVPLVRPFNISSGVVEFPIEGRKHYNFIDSTKSKKLLVQNGNYVLVKRFTTTEERRRIVAAVWAKDTHDVVGFENRINYYHSNGGGLDILTARGLWMFLNSTIVDSYFRQFNGSTQVNATDLRYIRYPSIDKIRQLGCMMEDCLGQKQLDMVVEDTLW